MMHMISKLKIAKFGPRTLEAALVPRLLLAVTTLCGSFSNNASAQPPVSATPTPRLAAPSNLVASGVTANQISLRWSVNSANEDGFEIERCETGGCVNFEQIAQVGLDVDNFVDSNLPGDTTFAYRVRAFNSRGHSSYSNIAQGTTQSNHPPYAPTSVTGKIISTGQIDLSWSDNSTNEDGFRIERCSSPGCVYFTEVAQVGRNVDVFSDTTISVGNTYRYRVHAFNSSGNSSYSDFVEFSIPESSDLTYSSANRFALLHQHSCSRSGK